MTGSTPFDRLVELQELVRVWVRSNLRIMVEMKKTDGLLLPIYENVQYVPFQDLENGLLLKPYYLRGNHPLIQLTWRPQCPTTTKVS